MFNSNNSSSKNKNESVKVKAANTASSPSTIGQGTLIEGVINCNNDIRIDGEIKGNINCQGKLIVGPEGRINGEVICQNAIVQGSVSGKLSVKEALEVQETAKLTGEIFTKRLQVQSGAIFNVKCDMSGKQIKSFTREGDEKGEVVSLVG